MSLFKVHCKDCGEHNEIYSRGESQEFCPACGSIEWKSCEETVPGWCPTCDQIIEEDSA